MTDYSNLKTSDLTEQSLLDLLATIKADTSMISRPRHMVVSEEGLQYGRDLAAKDPEFARRVREEFPDFADYLLGNGE